MSFSKRFDIALKLSVISLVLLTFLKSYIYIYFFFFALHAKQDLTVFARFFNRKLLYIMIKI